MAPPCGLIEHRLAINGSHYENKHLCHNYKRNTGNSVYWEAYSPHQRYFWQDVMCMSKGEMHMAAHITKGQMGSNQTNSVQQNYVMHSSPEALFDPND